MTGPCRGNREAKSFRPSCRSAYPPQESPAFRPYQLPGRTIRYRRSPQLTQTAKIVASLHLEKVTSGGSGAYRSEGSSYYYPVGKCRVSRKQNAHSKIYHSPPRRPCWRGKSNFVPFSFSKAAFWSAVSTA